MALSCCVYMIEDDEPVARSLSVLLTICGYQALRFASAEPFLSHVHDLPPGCILMNFGLPGADGLTALGELRRRDINWPVILMTGQDLNLLPPTLSQPGPCGILEKPFALEQLRAALNIAGPKVPRQGMFFRSSESLESGLGDHPHEPHRWLPLNGLERDWTAT